MTKSIVTGMHEHDVKRIVYTASAGIHNELLGISGKLIMRMLKKTLIGHRAATDYIEAHGLNYIIIIGILISLFFKIIEMIPVAKKELSKKTGYVLLIFATISIFLLFFLFDL